MKPFDENELIAYHLHELASRRELEIRQMLEADAVATAESDAIAETLREFRGYGAAPVVDAAVVERNWQSIRPSLAYLTPRPQRVSWLRSVRWQPLGVGLGLAGAAAGVVMVLLPHRVAGPVANGAPTAETVAPLAAGGGAVVGMGAPVKRVAPQRYNGRPGPLTTAPIDRGVDDTLLVAPGNRVERAEPGVAPPAVAGELPYSSSASAASDGQAGVTPVSNAAKSSRVRVRLSQPFREMDVALGGYGMATMSSAQDMGNGSRTVATRLSVGARASFHQQFKRWLGYEVAAEGTRTNVVYTYSNSSPLAFAAGSIGSNVFEVTGTYVVQGPRGKQVSSFADVGGGVVAFVPSQITQTITSNYRPAAVAGVGMEYHLSRHWGVRAEYRGLFLVSPTFNYVGTALPVASHKMLSSEPTLSLTYRFGGGTKTKRRSQ
jgi:hypothetical protein